MSNQIVNHQLFVDSINTLEQISLTQGKGSRKKIHQILRDNDNSFLRYILQVAYNPFIKTRIKTIDEVDADQPTVEPKLTFKQLVEGLCQQKAISNEWRDNVDHFLRSLPVHRWMEDFVDEDTGEVVSLQRSNNTVRQFAAKILTQSLNIGIDAKTINEALGTTVVPDLSFMLAEDDINKISWGEDAILAEVKYDGGRIAAEFIDDEIVFLTRSFNEVDATCLGNIRDQLKLIFGNLNGWFVDGEIIGKNRKSVNGKIGSIIKGKGTPYMDKDWTFVLFDMELSKVLRKDLVSCSTLITRRQQLLDYINKVSPELIPNIKVSQQFEVYDEEHLNELFEQQLALGEEGLVVKHGSSSYVTDRCSQWIKMKAEKECDLRIISHYPGKPGSKRAQYIGGFCCVSEDESLEVNIGGGYSDKLLQEINDNNPNSYIGKIIKVRYNAVIDKKNSDIKSLFLPRFIEFRHDKTQANHINEIK